MAEGHHICNQQVLSLLNKSTMSLTGGGTPAVSLSHLHIRGDNRLTAPLQKTLHLWKNHPVGFLFLNRPHIIHTSQSLASFTWCLETRGRCSKEMDKEVWIILREGNKGKNVFMELINISDELGDLNFRQHWPHSRSLTEKDHSFQVSHFKGSLCSICWQPRDDSLRNHINKSCGGPTHINRTTRTDYQASIGKENQSLSRQRRRTTEK